MDCFVSAADYTRPDASGISHSVLTLSVTPWALALIPPGLSVQKQARGDHLTATLSLEVDDLVILRSLIEGQAGLQVLVGVIEARDRLGFPLNAVN